jgi:CP family cyanate transporter-like MFS transporter
MKHSASPGAGPVSLHFVGTLALLWLAGMAIRLPLLVVPPVIPFIHDDLHMTETQVGVLMGLPLTMFAMAAVPGSLVISRFGVRLAAIAGLMIAALAAAARGLAIDVLTLFAATVLMGFGIAIVQPALPTLVRAWMPAKAWLATAVYTNGMLIGATLGPALTVPVVLPLFDGSWRLDLLVWAVPGLIVALLYATAAPRPQPHNQNLASTPGRWMPDWKDPLIWLLGGTLGANNAQFFAANGFIPDYLNSIGQRELIGLTLTSLNGAQLVASFVLLTMAERIQRKAWPFIVFGPLTVVGTVGIVVGTGFWIVASATLLGFAAALTFIVTFGLPAMLSPPGEVHRMAGGMFTISYSIAVAVPIVCGAFWDVTGIPWTSFIPLALCGVALTIFGTVLMTRSSGPPAPRRSV